MVWGPLSSDGLVFGPGSRNFKLERSWNFVFSDPVKLNLSDAPITSVALAFESNLYRQRAAIIMVLYCIQLSRELERCDVAAEYEIRHGVSPDMPNALPRDIQDRSFELFHEGSERQNSFTTEQRSEYMGAQISASFQKWQIISTSVAPEVKEGLDSLLVSIVVGAWTAFETMAGDLWESAVNACPQRLSALSGKPWRDGETEQDDTDFAPDKLRKDESKQIPLDLIRQYKYDLTKVMGTLLRGKFTFTTLDGIREAYWTAFKRNRVGVRACLQANCFDALSVLRNVMVHRAGVADSEYCRRAQGLPLPQAKPGQKIELDGSIVFPLAEAVRDRSRELLSEVDAWIQRGTSVPPG